VNPIRLVGTFGAPGRDGGPELHDREHRRLKAKCESSIKFHVRGAPAISRVYGSEP